MAIRSKWLMSWMFAFSCGHHPSTCWSFQSPRHTHSPCLLLTTSPRGEPLLRGENEATGRRSGPLVPKLADGGQDWDPVSSGWAPPPLLGKWKSGLRTAVCTSVCGARVGRDGGIEVSTHQLFAHSHPGFPPRSVGWWSGMTARACTPAGSSAASRSACPAKASSTPSPPTAGWTRTRPTGAWRWSSIPVRSWRSRNVWKEQWWDHQHCFPCGMGQ